MKILMIGDIVGEPGRRAVDKIVPLLKQREGINFVIANGENAAGGSGITPKIFQQLIRSGVDVVTSGDHIFKRREALELIAGEERLLRPANYPEGAAGKGSVVIPVNDSVKVGIINVNGRVFMDSLDCPFHTSMALLEKIKQETNIVIVDIHAEATSEKVALGWYLNGKATAVLGTHTHVQTADERILPEHNHTAYITDVGMTGPIDSVIGRKKEQVLVRFLTHVPTRFEVAEENVQLQGVIIDIDEQDGKARSITRVQESLPNNSN
ncbi:MAG: TIGR00282 family metallophosphoesterase [PVC group bacterium]|nr:TIGR00282 family metallophosphoesterase [PVC group bacterium]